eukprot:11822741-Karenia_brevis.AAC.1
MLGAVSPARTDDYCSNTSAALFAVVQSDTDVQCPYKVPLCSGTHESVCNDPGCCKLQDDGTK